MGIIIKIINVDGILPMCLAQFCVSPMVDLFLSSDQPLTAELGLAQFSVEAAEGL